MILLLYNLQGFAQRVKREELFLKQGMLGIMAGTAIPVMDFADDNFRLASGYANPGYNLRLAICYDITRDLGLAAQYNYINTPFNSREFLKDIRAAYQLNTTTTFNSYKSNPWTLQGLMAGIYYPFRSYRSTIDLKLMGGLLTGVLPENIINYTSNSSNTNFNVIQYESSGAGFGFQLGLSFRYRIYKNLLLLSAADFTYTEIKFQNLTIEDTNSGATGALPDYTQYYHIINISAGIGIQFD